MMGLWGMTKGIEDACILWGIKNSPGNPEAVWISSMLWVLARTSYMM